MWRPRDAKAGKGVMRRMYPSRVAGSIFAPKKPTSKELMQTVINRAAELGLAKRAVRERLGVTSDEDLDYLVVFQVAESAAMAAPLVRSARAEERMTAARDRLLKKLLHPARRRG